MPTKKTVTESAPKRRGRPPLPKPPGPGPGRPTKLVQIAQLAAAMDKANLPMRLAGTKRRTKQDETPGEKRKRTNAPPTKVAADRILNGGLLTATRSGELHPDATPLDVMIEAMRQAYKVGGALLAAPFAKEAAPYVHGKINNIDLKQTLHPNQGGQGGDTPVKNIGLHRFLVDYIDVEDVTPKDPTNGSTS